MEFAVSPLLIGFLFFICGHTNLTSLYVDFVIEMKGTKRIDISKAIMRSIMKIVLDDSNYPLLIHCNHGKVSASNVNPI